MKEKNIDQLILKMKFVVAFSFVQIFLTLVIAKLKFRDIFLNIQLT
jgi:hypothetical protein